MSSPTKGKKADKLPAYMKYKTRAVRHSANPADDETRRVRRVLAARSSLARARATCEDERPFAGRDRAPNSPS